MAVLKSVVTKKHCTPCLVPRPKSFTADNRFRGHVVRAVRIRYRNLFTMKAWAKLLLGVEDTIGGK